MRLILTNQSGFSRVMAIAMAILILGIAATVGYRTYSNQDKIVSYQGTLVFLGAEKCRAGTTCSNEYLQASSGKEYTLFLNNSGAKFVNNERAIVTGNPNKDNPSGAIDVISITPVNLTQR